MKVEGRLTPHEEGDSILDALWRADRPPRGVLCASGDCPNCLATIDGVSYMRMCQVSASAANDVRPFAASSVPLLPSPPERAPEVALTYSTADVIIIGAGESGSAEKAFLEKEGRSVITLEAAEGTEAIGIYPGPVVVARSNEGLTRYRSQEVVVATGSTDVIPVVPGSDLTRILTPSAVEHFTEMGFALDGLVTIGFSPDGISHTRVDGNLVRFEGEERVATVVVEVNGVESRYECRNVSVALGRYPRDLLLRMGEADHVRAVGSVAEPGMIPACPESGVVCPCSGVTRGDLDFVWGRGFQELELLKRATLAGTGTCQGSVCSPYLRAFVQSKDGGLQPTFTARPPARQLTVAEAAAGHFPPIAQRTPLHDVQVGLGARMDRVGGWWRPWSYGDPGLEYRSVREAVSLGDVSTLGKFLVDGPDSVRFLERIYPCRVGDLKPGRSRYSLLLAESGAVMDDGLISRETESRFALTFTSGGATVAEAWLRDWAGAFEADVRIMDLTHSLAAINVTGPLATPLLERVGVGELPSFMSHVRTQVADLPCTVHRLSFTGEVSYELHHSPSLSTQLWTALMGAGGDLGIHPHGMETLLLLRLEKGHIIVGMDTEPDSDPRRLGMNWAVDMSKSEFVGRRALVRTGALPLDKRLIGLTLQGDPPLDGEAVFDGESIVGYVTTAGMSPTLEKTVMMAWVRLDDAGSIPKDLSVARKPARRSSIPFYDPGGTRARL